MTRTVPPRTAAATQAAKLAAAKRRAPAAIETLDSLGYVVLVPIRMSAQPECDTVELILDELTYCRTHDGIHNP
jgi:hypothetical protein